MPDFNSTEQAKEFRNLLEEIQDKLEDIATDQGKSFNNTLESAKEALSQIRINTELTKEVSDEHLRSVTAIGDIFGSILEHAQTIGREEFSPIDPNELLEAHDILNDDLELYGLLSEAITDATIKHEEMNKVIASGKEQLDEFVDKLVSPLEDLPGSGWIQKFFDFSEVKNSIKENLTDKMIAFVKQGDFSATAVATSFRGAFSSIGDSISSAFGPLGLIVAAVISLGALAVSRFKDLDETTRSIRDTSGVIGDQLDDLVSTVQRLNVENARYGIDIDKSSGIVSSIIDNFDSMLYVTDQNAKTIAAMSVALGISDGESAGILKTFSNLTGTTGEGLDNLAGQVDQLSLINKVAPAKVFSDIAASGGEIFGYMEATPEVIAKTAVRARQLGLELGNVTSIAENLLNFGSSIESQMNASVLLGRMINLEQARYLAFLGKTDEMLEEVVNQVGSFEELQSLLPHQQRALADAIGVSVTELRNLVRSQEVLNDLGEGFIDNYEAASNLSLSEMLDTEGVLTPLEEMGSALKSIATSLATILLPLFKVLSPVLKIVAGAFNLLADGINVVMDGLGALWDLLPDIGEYFEWLPGTLSAATVAAAAFFLGSNPIGWAVATVGAIGLVYKHWESIIDFFKDTGSNILDYISAPFLAAFDYILEKLKGIGQNTLDVLVNPFLSGFSYILEGIKGIGENILDALVWPFQAAWDYIFGNTIWDSDEIFNIILDSITTPVKAAFNILSSLLPTGGLAGQFSSFIDSISPQGFDVEIPKTVERIVKVESTQEDKKEVIQPVEIDNKDVVEKLEELIAIMKRGSVIQLDGKKVGRALASAQTSF